MELLPIHAIGNLGKFDWYFIKKSCHAQLSRLQSVSYTRASAGGRSNWRREKAGWGNWRSPVSTLFISVHMPSFFFVLNPDFTIPAMEAGGNDSGNSNALLNLNAPINNQGVNSQELQPPSQIAESSRLSDLPPQPNTDLTLGATSNHAPAGAIQSSRLSNVPPQPNMNLTLGAPANLALTGAIQYTWNSTIVDIPESSNQGCKRQRRHLFNAQTDARPVPLWCLEPLLPTGDASGPSVFPDRLLGAPLGERSPGPFVFPGGFTDAPENFVDHVSYYRGKKFLSKNGALFRGTSGYASGYFIECKGLLTPPLLYDFLHVRCLPCGFLCEEHRSIDHAIHNVLREHDCDLGTCPWCHHSIVMEGVHFLFVHFSFVAEIRRRFGDDIVIEVLFPN